jgi:hypothetical protein
MEQELLNITLSDGKVVKSPRQSYVVQEWNCGKWQNVAVYPPTKDGYKEAHEKMNAIDNDYARVMQFM